MEAFTCKNAEHTSNLLSKLSAILDTHLYSHNFPSVYKDMNIVLFDKI